MKLQPKKRPIKLKTPTGPMTIKPHQIVALHPKVAAKLLKEHPDRVKRVK